MSIGAMCVPSTISNSPSPLQILNHCTVLLNCSSNLNCYYDIVFLRTQMNTLVPWVDISLELIHLLIDFNTSRDLSKSTWYLQSVRCVSRILETKEDLLSREFFLHKTHPHNRFWHWLTKSELITILTVFKLQMQNQEFIEMIWISRNFLEHLKV